MTSQPSKHSKLTIIVLIVHVTSRQRFALAFDIGCEIKRIKVGVHVS